MPKPVETPTAPPVRTILMRLDQMPGAIGWWFIRKAQKNRRSMVAEMKDILEQAYLNETKAPDA